MQIQIQFISVDVEDKGKYKMAEVAYKDIAKGQVSSKKLMSFNNPAVYKTIVDAKKGETYSIEMQKNEKGYWDWTAASLAGASNAPETSTKSAGSTGFTSPKSTYETPEERAQKQVYIVRQSSLSTAVEYLAGTGAIKKASAQDVIFCAKEFEGYVFGQETSTPTLAELPVVDDLGGDDIPY